jgi:hypothetical protein
MCYYQNENKNKNENILQTLNNDLHQYNLIEYIMYDILDVLLLLVELTNVQD